jgi:hypothetical protein
LAKKRDSKILFVGTREFIPTTNDNGALKQIHWIYRREALNGDKYQNRVHVGIFLIAFQGPAEQTVKGH